MVGGRLVAHPWTRGSFLPSPASYQAERFTSTGNIDDDYLQCADCTLLYFRLHFWQRYAFLDKKATHNICRNVLPKAIEMHPSH